MFPTNTSILVESYFSDRVFQVKFGIKLPSSTRSDSVLDPSLTLLATYQRHVAHCWDVRGRHGSVLPATKTHKPHQTTYKNMDGFIRWMRQWKIEVNGSKSIHTTFTVRWLHSPPVAINNIPLSQSDIVPWSAYATW